MLISTGTRALQDQLFSKDLPLIAARARSAGARGGLEGARQLPLSPPPEQAQAQLALGDGGGCEPSCCSGCIAGPRITRSGDLAEMRGLSDSHPIWPP